MNKSLCGVTAFSCNLLVRLSLFSNIFWKKKLNFVHLRTLHNAYGQRLCNNIA